MPANPPLRQHCCHRRLRFLSLVEKSADRSDVVKGSVTVILCEEMVMGCCCVEMGCNLGHCEGLGSSVISSTNPDGRVCEKGPFHRMGGRNQTIALTWRSLVKREGSRGRLENLSQ
jgi:hypothetical protein